MTINLTSTDVITVAEYSARIGRALRTVGAGVVEGEVQRPKVTPGGMLVFDLTDGTAKLACKVFRSQVARLEHDPRHGELVQVNVDRPDLWAQGGKLDIIVSDIRLAGEGELLRRREELLVRLTAEGLCDPGRRKQLPRFPRAVGVIAGTSSDGLRDVVAALHDRYAPVHIVTCPAVVQGARAPLDIIDALAQLNAHPLVDVIVIARGGGSVQDLVAFDDERLCRAVFACGTPVITAIGHTDNIPVCNHVAWSSQTPSRSAELAVPSAAGLRQDLQLAAARLAPCPARVRTLRTDVRSVRVDVARAFHARQLEVAAAGGLREAESSFFRARETGLAHTRAVLVALPGRIPAPADIVAFGARLDAHATTYYADRAELVRRTGDVAATVTATLIARGQRVREAAVELRSVSPTLTVHAAAVTRTAPSASTMVAALRTRRERADEQGRRVAAGIRKELADHLYDYGRALPKRLISLRIAADRAIARDAERADSAASTADDGARRGIVRAATALEHVRTVLAASDPRRRGWALPTNAGGTVVRSAGELAIGDHLTLSFHDGAAGAVINDIQTPENP